MTTAATAPDGAAGAVRSAVRALSARVGRNLRVVGPGFITGAADDDPSGISTYATAGAAFGYATLWTTLFSVPLMAAVQYMCARVGLVTGRGLTGVLRARYPAWVVWSACALLVVANTVNVAADLSGIASALELVTGVRSIWYHCVAAALLIALLVWTSYRTLARVLMGLTFSLLAYVAAAWLARPAWDTVLRATLLPPLRWDRAYLVTLVAIFGTTISPYLFVWQAAQEVEEVSAARRSGVDATGRAGARSAGGATALAANLRAARRDVLAGMSFSNLIAFFIMLTTGATLYAAGQRDVPSAEVAAAALRPLAGDGASLLFALGLVGTGLLGVPVLAGSTAYAVAEARGWRAGMNEPPSRARQFYLLVAAGLGLGMLLDHVGLSGFRVLYWAAVTNGLLAPPLIALILVVCNDWRVMGQHVNQWWTNVLGGATVVLMTAAAAALLVVR